MSECVVLYNIIVIIITIIRAVTLLHIHISRINHIVCTVINFFREMLKLCTVGFGLYMCMRCVGVRYFACFLVHFFQFQTHFAGYFRCYDVHIPLHT